LSKQTSKQGLISGPSQFFSNYHPNLFLPLILWLNGNQLKIFFSKKLLMKKELTTKRILIKFNESANDRLFSNFLKNTFGVRIFKLNRKPPFPN